MANSADGQIQTVKYQVLDSTTLNEVQRFPVGKEEQPVAADLGRLRQKIGTAAAKEGIGVRRIALESPVVVYALEKAPTASMPKAPAQTTILVLVSDPLVRAVTQEVLEQEGYSVVTAGDLGGAVDWLKQLSPDLLITRIYIEHMPGHEAAKYLRKKRPGMPVLIMSGLLDDERLADRESLAGFEIFPKPYSTSLFLEKVKEVLSKSRG